MANPGKLSAKQIQFFHEYEVDFNATQAAIRAGYSPKTAHVQGCRLLKHVNGLELLKERKEERLRKAGVHAERVLTESARIGYSDARKLFDPLDGSLKPVKEWDDDIAAAVSSVEVREEFQGVGEDRVKIGETKKIRLWDKTKGLEQLGKNLKLFTDRLEFPDKDGNPMNPFTSGDMEIAARISYFLDMAMKRKADADLSSGKSDKQIGGTDRVPQP